MPEMPEVETTRRDLTKYLVGDKFTGEGFCDWKKMIKGEGFEKFFEELKGAKIESLDRRAKVLIINLSNNKSLLSHFKMTGHYLLMPDEDSFVPYTSVLISKKESAVADPHLRQGRKLPAKEAFKFYQKNWDRFIHVMFRLKTADLLYSDIRKFGWFKLVETAKLSLVPEIAELGPEPFSEEFTFEYLKKQFAKTNRKVKQVLMDQTEISGIGNIYADEILWEAKVHPEAPANKLSVWQIQAIYDAVKPVLEKGLKYVGSSIGEYRRIDNSFGKTQEYFNAYGREGLPCKRDGEILKKIKVGQRSAVFCPKEQKI